MRTRIHADGWLDITDRRRVRTPGIPTKTVAPALESEALAFLLSHSFPGHRRVARAMTEIDRRKIQIAIYADSVNERMTLVDRVWRDITEPVDPPKRQDKAQLIQVIRFGNKWAYPLYLEGAVTRVLPHGGVPIPMSEKQLRKEELQLNLGGD